MQATKNKKTFKKNKQSFGFIDFTQSRSKEEKFAELKPTAKSYYGIGRDKETDRLFILDYTGKSRLEAEAYLDAEFHSIGAVLESVHAYK